MSRRPAQATRGSPALARAPHVALATALGCYLFYGAWLARFHRVIVPMMILLFVCWWFLSSDDRRPGRRLSAIAMMAYGALILQLGRLIEASLGVQAGITFERLTALFPLAALVGFHLVRSGWLQLYYRVMLIVALVTVVPALLEYLANVSVLNANHAQFVRNGQTRAVVGADHPLVLASMFLGMIPMTKFALAKFQRLAAAWLLLGVLATGSNGPSVLGVVVLLPVLFPPVATALVGSRRLLSALLLGILGYLAVGAAFLWGTEFHGTSTTAASNEYRAGLYYLLPRVLDAHPFGFGLTGLPPDTFTFSTVGSGLIDVSNTVDSEVVYAAGQFGIAAVLLYIGFCVIGISAAVRHHAMGLSTLAVTLTGLFVALHAWDTMGTYWMLGIGAATGVLAERNAQHRWLGLMTRPPLTPRQAPRQGPGQGPSGPERPALSNQQLNRIGAR